MKKRVVDYISKRASAKQNEAAIDEMPLNDSSSADLEAIGSPRPRPKVRVRKRKHNMRMFMFILLGLIALLLLFTLWQWKSHDKAAVIVPGTVDTSVAANTDNDSSHLTNVTSEQSDVLTDEEALTTANSMSIPPAPSELNAEPRIIHPDAILLAPLPTSNVLAKEEIQRLADETARLEEQEALLAEQAQMLDDVNSKKEQQIELLEKQITLLEQHQPVNITSQPITSPPVND